MNPRDRAALRQHLHGLLVAAGNEAMAAFGHARADHKRDGSQVTEADRAAEALLVEGLRRAFPRDAIVGEEGARIDGEGDLWLIDPIDGTGAFVEGLAHWGPTICRLRAGQLDVGALWLPRLEEFWFATRGGGAWRNGERLHPAPLERIHPHDSLYAPSRFHQRPAPAWPGKIRALGSSAVHLAAVAHGGAAATVIPRWKLWDVGAGALFVREAGRQIRTPDGAVVQVELIEEGLPFMAGAPSALDVLTDNGWAERALASGDS